MLDKNIKKINYKVTENMLHSGCVNKADFNNLTNKFNNLTDKYRVIEDKLIEVFNENNDLCENNQFLQKENEILKKQLEDLKIIVNKDFFICDELLYIDFDIFEYESDYSLENQINYYEEQLEILDNIFSDNDIYSTSQLRSRLSNSCNINKYDNIFNILEIANINLKSQNSKIDELNCKYNELDIRIKKFKKRIEQLPIGTVLEINGVKKTFKGKIEKTIDKINKMEKEFEEYCQHQIKWARGILGTKYSDDEIIKLIDIYNKLKNDIVKESSDSECELDTIVNKYNMKTKKIEEYKFLVELGNSFINNNINDKSQIKNFIKNNKEIIYSYDSKDKINRFISTCKRLYYLNQKIEIYNIVKSKCMTAIRDMNNNDFDNLLKLLDVKN